MICSLKPYIILAYVSENFRNLRLEINELDPACFFTASRLAWQVALTLIKLGSLQAVFSGDGVNLIP